MRRPVVTLLAIVTKDAEKFWPFLQHLHESVLEQLDRCVDLEWFLIVEFKGMTINFELPGADVYLIDRAVCG